MFKNFINYEGSKGIVIIILFFLFIIHKVDIEFVKHYCHHIKNNVNDDKTIVNYKQRTHIYTQENLNTL